MKRYWAFAANPKVYRVEEAIVNREYDYWTTKGSKVAAGDYVIIWKTSGVEKKRGIISLGIVETNPLNIDDVTNSYWIDSENGKRIEPRVKVRYLSNFSHLPLWVGSEADDLLLNLSVAKSQGGTVFKISTQQWEEILHYLAIDDIEDFISSTDIVRHLKKYDDYSREDVHNIFSPETNFVPQTGTWGLRGLIPIPSRLGDFVFFVTLGKRQGDYQFDEGITSEGVLSWQSQPHQSLDNRIIQQLICHNDLSNSIYLFLRSSEGKPYTYLGLLKYLSHDIDREKPVHFQWQILEWDPGDTPNRIGLILQQTKASTHSQFGVKETRNKSIFVQVDAPERRKRLGTSSYIFKYHKNGDNSEKDDRNKKLGLCGELLVLEYEKNKLINKNLQDFAEKVRHVSKIEGDGAGYDIQSFTEQGGIIFIEVKTTTGGLTSSFYISSNEVEFSRKHPEDYFLFRVFDYDQDTNSAKFYVLQGNIDSHLELTPTEFRASLTAL